MLEMIKIKPYSVHESSYMLQASELYSETLEDPLTDSAIHAMDNLAFDKDGNKLTFSTVLSIFAQGIDREKEFLEDKPITYRRWDQKLNISVIVWNNEKDKELFDNNDNIHLI